MVDERATMRMRRRRFGDTARTAAVASTPRLSALGPDERKKLTGEKERIGRLGRIRQIVFGSLDGLLVPLGVISGVAGGTGSARAVIIAGLAEAFAGAISMGAGEFISARAEAQVHQAEVRSELQGIEANPDEELRELMLLLQSEGIAVDDSRVIATKLQTTPHAYAKTMVEKELGLGLHPDAVKVPEALTMGASYAIASTVPLAPYFFLPVGRAFIVSLAASSVALIVIGVIKGKLAKLSLVRSTAEIVIVGTVSGLGGYLIGSYLPKLLGY